MANGIRISNIQGDTPNRTITLNTQSKGEVFLASAVNAGAAGLEGYVECTPPADGAGVSYNRLFFYECELNPENNATEYNVTIGSLDCHVDRNANGGNYSASLTLFQNNLTVEGANFVQNIVGTSCGITIGNGTDLAISDQVAAHNINVQVSNASTVDRIDGLNITINAQAGSSVTDYVRGLTIGITGAYSQDVYALEVNTSGATSSGGTVYAARLFGDVLINGDLSMSGEINLGSELNCGKLDAFATSNVVDGGGTPTIIHSLVTAVTAPNGVTTANADMIGVNTACLITIEENSQTTAGPFSLGICALALPAAVSTQTGSNIDYISGATFAVNLDASSTGGTVTNLRGCRAALIPNGVTTVTNAFGFYFDAPFGNVNADNTWGFYDKSAHYNYFNGSVKIGSGSDKTANSSVGLELEATDKAMLLSRLTAAQIAALTPLAGMILYNTDTNKAQCYNGSSWVDLF